MFKNKLLVSLGIQLPEFVNYFLKFVLITFLFIWTNFGDFLIFLLTLAALAMVENLYLSNSKVSLSSNKSQNI